MNKTIVFYCFCLLLLSGGVFSNSSLANSMPYVCSCPSEASLAYALDIKPALVEFRGSTCEVNEVGKCGGVCDFYVDANEDGYWRVHQTYCYFYHIDEDPITSPQVGQSSLPGWSVSAEEVYRTSDGLEF